MKVAIIGCGNLAAVHIRKIRALDISDIAIVDIDAKRLEDFSRQHDIASCYRDVGHMLQDFKPDVCHIVTPPAAHIPIARDVVAAGSSVLIEKPAAVSSEQLNLLDKALAQRPGTVVVVDHMRAYDQMIKSLQSLLGEQKYGKVVSVSANYYFDYDEKKKFDPTTRWMSRLRGGPFFDVLPHVLSVIEAVIGPVSLSSHHAKVRVDGTAEELWAIFEGGEVMASVHMSLNIMPLKNTLEVECENAHILVDLRNFLLIIRPRLALPNAVERILGNLMVGGAYAWGSIKTVINFVRGKLDPYQGMGALIEDFYRCVNSATPLQVDSYEQAKRYLAISEALFEPVEEAKPLTVTRDCDVLVTGGTGFLGRRLVQSLLDSGSTVRILSHRGANAQQLFGERYVERVEIISGDIYDYATVKACCKGVKAVFHLAAAMGGGWNYHLDTTVTGTANIYKACIECGVEHLLYASTLNVYQACDYQDGGIVDESFPYESMPEARGFYSAAKLQAEKRLLQDHEEDSSCKLSILRPGLIFGPGLDPLLGDLGIPVGKHLVVCMGMGRRSLPLVYIDHVVDAFMALHEAGAEGIYNVMDASYPTQREYLHALNSLSANRRYLVPIPYTVWAMLFTLVDKLLGKTFRYRLKALQHTPNFSTSKLSTQTRWTEHSDFVEGLRASLAAHREAD